MREAARVVGLDRFIIETDCPYLTPEPKRSAPNEPAYLAYTAQYAAELFGVGLDVFRAHAYQATCRAYGLALA
ncbi:MAG: hypothetical protein B7X06_03745 [Verrucomicrobia bacterium 21-51-4]|nr:MAG: hypothetical protein B7X06_03745 [Verrucomicrobia bacterium 21-51-4]